MSDSVGIGILGFAHGHVGTYCAKWADMPEARLVAGWDHDAARAESNCKTRMTSEASASSLLARADVDAVVIGAETLYHADLVEQAAAAGKAIILQKPLALTMEQADRIVAAVEQAGVMFTVAWQMRVDPQNLAIKEVLEQKKLGRIFMVRRRHGLSTHVWPNFDRSWHADPTLNRGMWADDAAHPIDLLYWLFGMPLSVTAQIDTLCNPNVPDDQGIAIFRYADGMFAHVDSSFTCLAGENTTEIVGEKGVLIQNFGDGVSAAAPRLPGAVGLKWIMQGDKQWTASDIPSPHSQSERIGDLARPLLDFLLGHRGPIATAAEGRDVLRMTLASYESSDAGARVDLTSRAHKDAMP